MDKKLAAAKVAVDKKVSELDLGWDEKEQKVAFKTNHDKLLKQKQR